MKTLKRAVKLLKKEERLPVVNQNKGELDLHGWHPKQCRLLKRKSIRPRRRRIGQ